MLIHLPIAQIAVDPLILIAIGMLVGFLSGLFGVGGGFLLTPLLIFYGVPAAVAVSTQGSCHIDRGRLGPLARAAGRYAPWNPDADGRSCGLHRRRGRV